MKLSDSSSTLRLPLATAWYVGLLLQPVTPGPHVAVFPFPSVIVRVPPELLEEACGVYGAGGAGGAEELVLPGAEEPLPCGTGSPPRQGTSPCESAHAMAMPWLGLPFGMTGN